MSTPGFPLIKLPSLVIDLIIESIDPLQQLFLCKTRFKSIIKRVSKNYFFRIKISLRNTLQKSIPFGYAGNLTSINIIENVSEKKKRGRIYYRNSQAMIYSQNEADAISEVTRALLEIFDPKIVVFCLQNTYQFRMIVHNFDDTIWNLRCDDAHSNDLPVEYVFGKCWNLADAKRFLNPKFASDGLKIRICQLFKCDQWMTPNQLLLFSRFNCLHFEQMMLSVEQIRSFLNTINQGDFLFKFIRIVGNEEKDILKIVDGFNARRDPRDQKSYCIQRSNGGTVSIQSSRNTLLINFFKEMV